MFEYSFIDIHLLSSYVDLRNYIQIISFFFFVNYLADHRCDNGQCLADGDKKSDDPSVYTLVMIGVAVTVFGLIAIIGGIVYRHQRRIATTGKTSGTFSEFFDSPRREISVGYRVRSSTSQTQTPEIHQEMPKSNP